MDIYKAIRPLLFAIAPEDAHALAFWGMRAGNGALLRAALPMPEQQTQMISLLGLSFHNRIGLAAGLDKNALCLGAWAHLGFGHVEIGTVTPRPQAGNPRPRLFRLVEDQALLNRMGFNNDGAATIRKRLEKRPPANKLIIGGNIGKNKVTEEVNAFKDYLECLVVLHGYVDYFTLNVSSPNTQGLRNLQGREPLVRLLTEVQNKNAGYAKPAPILLKISPDLSPDALETVLEVAAACQINGIVATNTTLCREGLSRGKTEIENLGTGGISGAPLTMRAEQFCRDIRQQLPEKMVLVASGGVMSSADVANRLALGADFVQLYTGLVYSGPRLIAQAIEAGAKK